MSTAIAAPAIERFSISNDPDWYEAFPDVALTARGRLVCVIAECTHHGDRGETRIAVCHSDDRGATWSPKRHVTGLHQGKGTGHYNCPRITALRDGRLVVAVDRLYSPEQSASPDDCQNVLLFSSDEGETWGPEIMTPVRGIVPDRLIELRDGRWLLAAHYLDKDLDRRLIQRVWWTDDQGASWYGPAIVGDQEGLNLCEVSIVAVDDTLVAFHRENSGQGWDCYKTMSFDRGEHWTTPVRFPLPACHRPVAGLLKDGRLLITHRFMQGGLGWVGWWTQNTFAALTDRASALAQRRNDAHARIMPLDFDRSPHSDTGYTGWVQFDDGEIYVVNYILDDAPKAQIRGYRFRPEVMLWEER
ncbi:MAG: sialidase family protein [Planctomycetota bacterium]|jgi:hypothetical protein|nr:sialidase family protein [Planctomycetota bacterium]